MTKILASGKTIEIAVQNGLAQLQVTEDRVKVVVVEQPTKGFLGLIGSKDAKVELELIPDPKEEAN
jgi:spoIIIJ-associated protein